MPGSRGGEVQRGALLVRVEVDRRGGEGVAAVGVGVVQFGERDVELSGVEGDGVGPMLDGHVDLHIAGEGGRRQVGRQDQPVGVGPDCRGQPVGGGPSDVDSSVVEALMSGRLPSGRADDRLRFRRNLEGLRSPARRGGRRQRPRRRAGVGHRRRPDGPRAGQGHHGPGRSRALAGHLRRHGPDHRGLGGVGGQHGGRGGCPRRPGCVPRTGGRRSAGAGLHPRHPVHRGGLRPDADAGHARARR